MRTVELKLHPRWMRHTGHCQITYISLNQDGLKIVHCLQLHYGIRLMRCSQDGEPNYEVSFDKINAVFERAPESEGKLAKLANEWIDKYESREKK